MRADNTEQLITAARRRHEFTRSKTIRALQELDDTGTMITFETVARKAQVSRSWLYTQPDIRTEIERLRALGRRTAPAPLPARQRSSDPSLQKRLEAINSRNRDLVEENTRLRRRLAESLGLLRAAGIRDPGDGHRDPTQDNSLR